MKLEISVTRTSTCVVDVPDDIPALHKVELAKHVAVNSVMSHDRDPEAPYGDRFHHLAQAIGASDEEAFDLWQTVRSVIVNSRWEGVYEPDGDSDLVDAEELERRESFGRVTEAYRNDPDYRKYIDEMFGPDEEEQQ